MQHRCSSLVTFTGSERRIQFDHKGPNLKLKLAHASVADYLLQTKYQGPSNFHFDYSSAQNFLAQSCLGYLMNSAFASGYSDQSHRHKSVTYPFLEHSVEYWPKYVGGSKDNPDFKLDSVTLSLLQAFFNTSKLPNGGNFSSWVGMLIPGASIKVIQSTQPLYYAASFGLTDVVRMILETEKDLDIDALGGRAQSSALHVATYRDHPNIMKMLLERGANPDLPNCIGETPLFWATGNVSHSHKRKDLLLQYGATPFGKSTIREKILLTRQGDNKML
jgi:hypothetical protein